MAFKNTWEQPDPITRTINRGFPAEVCKITSIRVPATWTDEEGIQRFEPATFKLGEGPCGKTVSSLSVERAENDNLVIEQCHTDGSRKVFSYAVNSIIGRVEVLHELVRVSPV